MLNTRNNSFVKIIIVVIINFLQLFILSRQRGLIRVYDFSYDPLYNRLPLICSSKYDEPSASFHHLDLRLPYDKLDN